ncbi:putative metallo-hydrolase [Aquisphaera giovannonii]|uniref:Putative metallo-hydrolase n=1 Tax=Aquisphaera giovannonii TaxID=406548 RepID=A0A5B9VYW1_9BACT|nr:MBL fold metallo-hydrolase [Aquisphaera giovannonii]QEH33498.1 putative metallo-hydrolase [Aquisphaera giovannonii]
MSASSYAIEVVVSEPFGQNAYVLWREGRDDALVFDPGFDPRGILSILRSNGRRPAMILDTHGHVDHIAGNAALKDAFPDVPLVIGRNEVDALTDPDVNLSGPYGIPVISPPADRLVDDGERIQVAGFDFEVREIPGHSKGSVVYVFSGEQPPFVLGGDVLFAGSIGRTDLGGDLQQLLSGIGAKLMNLPDDTRVYSGHGPVTTIGQERRSNPYIRQFATSRPR